MSDISSNPVVDWSGMINGAQLTQAQTGQAQAQTGLVNQQTQAAGMQNQLTKARMPLIMQALSDYNDSATNDSGASGATPAAPAKGAAAPSPDASGDQSPETSWYDPKAIDSTMRSQFFVPPYTSQEAKQIQTAALSGDAGLLEYAKSRRQMRIDSQTAQSQYGANNLYEAIHTVTDAEPGTALAQLTAIAPNTSKKIKEMIPDEADEDAAARAYAAHVGGTVHQYTGREAVARADGTYIDKVTGRPIPGVEKSGLSEDQWVQLSKAANTLVDIPDGEGHTVKVPQWRANGAPDQQSWMLQQAAHGGDKGSQPTVGGAPKAVAAAAAQKGIAAHAATIAAQPAAEGGAQPGTTTTNGQPDPKMSAFLSDPEFKYVPPRQKFGTSLSPDEQDVKTKQVDAANSLKEDADKGIPAVQSSLTFYKAAQDILDSKGANTGKWQSVIAKAGQWVPGVQIPQTSNYQELAKYLGNAALQSGKQLFPKMTQKEGDWLLNKLNPSPDMTDTAVRDMVHNGAALSQYTLDGAQKIKAYLRQGGDATQFYTALAKHFPMSDAVGQKPAAAPAAPKYSDAQINAYAAKHGVPVAQVRAHFLGSK